MTEGEQTIEVRGKPMQVGAKLIIINPNNEMLLLKRNPETHLDVGDNWDIPGGRIFPKTEKVFNFNTREFDALKREVAEEIGWTPAENQQITFLAKQKISPKDKPEVVRLTYLLKSETPIEVTPSREHTEYKWIPLSELSSIKYLDSTLKVLINENKFFHESDN